MKIVCESCHAKYQIPDERVAGRKLKIRCKRCGEMVMIDGFGLEPATTVAAVDVATGKHAAPAAGIEWHASVEGENYGPFDQAQLLAWLAQTPEAWDAYVWREGFSGWIEARTCSELVNAAGGAASLPPGAAIPAPTEDEGPTRMFQGGPVMEPAPPARPQSASPSSRPRVSVSRAPSAPAHPGAPSAHASSPSSPALRASHGVSQAPSSRVNVAPARPSQTPHSRPSMSAATASAPAYDAVPEPQLRAPSSIRPAAQSAPRMSPASSPRVSAAQAFAGERHEDSVLFSTRNLQQVARTSSAPPGFTPSAQAGYARGDGSGLIDIRALASLARQQPSVAPPMPHLRGSQPVEYSHGEESRVVLQQAGAFNRIDSLAPVATNRPSSNALPLAIFGGFGLVAAAAFAAIVITRSQAAPVAAVTLAQPALAAAAMPSAPQQAEPAQPTAQPTAELAKPEPAAEPTAAAVDAKDSKAEAEPAVVAEPTHAATRTADAKGAGKRRVRSARSTDGDKKSTTPEEKTKDKDKDKDKAGAPPSLDDVMLADKGSDAKPAKAAKDEPAPAPEESKPAPAAKESADVDDLLGAKPAKQPAKSRSIDDLLDGAVEKKKEPAAAVAENLPESPSRDETLAAMRGVESAVQACGNGATGTANVSIQVSGATGRVTSANVEGITGAPGSCIAKAVRAAKFPHFSKASFAVKFPYRLQ